METDTKTNRRFLKILARATDHKWGENGGQPTEPNLSPRDALISFILRMCLVALNIATCFAVIANVFRHWN